MTTLLHEGVLDPGETGLLGPIPPGVELSFEFFPAKTPEMDAALWQAIRTLEPLGPRFVSVTSGAGGTAQDGTVRTVKEIKAYTALELAAHLTCTHGSRDAIDAIARDYWSAGVRRIVALRGDAPAGAGAYHPRRDGYAYSSDLVEGLRRVADFDVSVAAYPEKHPEARSLAEDIDTLKRKIDAGAARAISQYFFDCDAYFRFLDHVHAREIDAPLVAGLLPITNFNQVVAFSKKCGATVPVALHRLFEGIAGDPEASRLMGMVVLAEQVRRLLAGGVRAFHIYTLNRAVLSSTLGRLLGADRERSFIPERAALDNEVPAR